MQQYQIRIPASRALAETLAEMIEAAMGEDGPVSWSEDEETRAWSVEGWFFAETAGALEGQVRAALGELAAGLEIAVEPVPEDVDWVAKSLAGLSPVIAGRFVVHGAHDRDALPKPLIGLQVEANQAFGTGHHPTTWGCLVALSELLNKRKFGAVFDLGSGSGVLAIAVAKLTGRPVVASDIDPLAVDIALENAAINGVDGLVSAVTAAGFDHPALADASFDLVIANILAGPLIELAPAFRARTRKGANVILSGILTRQAPDVAAAYAVHGFVLGREIRRKEWSTLILSRLSF